MKSPPAIPPSARQYFDDGLNRNGMVILLTIDCPWSWATQSTDGFELSEWIPCESVLIHGCRSSAFPQRRTGFHMWAPRQRISLTRHVCWLVSVPNYRSRLAEEGLEKRPLKTGGKTCRSILIATASSKKLASWRSALRHERHSRSTGGSRMPYRRLDMLQTRWKDGA